MPIYEYECGDCRSQFELLVRNSEQVRCKACGSTRLEKLLSVPAAHTSGSSSTILLATAVDTFAVDVCNWSSVACT